MDKLVRKIEIPLARKVIEKAGLYIVKESDLERLADVATDAYVDYPLHNWLTKGKYDRTASKLIMQITLKTMTKDAVIYADSEEMNGFAGNEYIGWGTHEQYFYPHYFNYEPDYRERIFRAVDWCHRHGYRPATLTEVALEPRF